MRLRVMWVTFVAGLTDYVYISVVDDDSDDSKGELRNLTRPPPVWSRDSGGRRPGRTQQHTESIEQYRMFAKRSTRFTITDPNRSVVGFSQVCLIAD